MARPVIATPEAVRPFTFQPDRDLLIASGADEFATAVRAALARGSRITAMALQARRRVVADYDWEPVERQMQGLVEEAVSVRVREPARREAR